MNKPLLKELIKEVQAEPLRMDMLGWVTIDDEIAPCGSTACIAGTVVAMDLRKQSPTSSWKRLIDTIHSRQQSCGSRAQGLLELTVDQAGRLFFVSEWPYEFRKPYNAICLKNCSSEEKRRRKTSVVIRRIRHFIRTNGKE